MYFYAKFLEFEPNLFPAEPSTVHYGQLIQVGDRWVVFPKNTIVFICFPPQTSSNVSEQEIQKVVSISEAAILIENVNSCSRLARDAAGPTEAHITSPWASFLHIRKVNARETEQAEWRRGGGGGGGGLSLGSALSYKKPEVSSGWWLCVSGLWYRRGTCRSFNDLKTFWKSLFSDESSQYTGAASGY